MRARTEAWDRTSRSPQGGRCGRRRCFPLVSTWSSKSSTSVGSRSSSDRALPRVSVRRSAKPQQRLERVTVSSRRSGRGTSLLDRAPGDEVLQQGGEGDRWRTDRPPAEHNAPSGSLTMLISSAAGPSALGRSGRLLMFRSGRAGKLRSPRSHRCPRARARVTQ